MQNFTICAPATGVMVTLLADGYLDAANLFLRGQKNATRFLDTIAQPFAVICDSDKMAIGFKATPEVGMMDEDEKKIAVAVKIEQVTEIVQITDDYSSWKDCSGFETPQ